MTSLCAHGHVLALYFVSYNFARRHQTLRRISDRPRLMDDIAALIDASEPSPKTRGPHKPQQSARSQSDFKVSQYPPGTSACRARKPAILAGRFPVHDDPPQRTRASIGVVGIGNAIVDVIAHADDEFLARGAR
jgi:hypothetical protein